MPGIIFAVWFSWAVFVLIAEDLKGMNALLKSKEYVKGKWGSVFWRLLFIYGISFILIFTLLKIFLGKEISNFVIGLFLTPLVTIYLFLLYSHLKSLKGEFTFSPNSGKKASFIFVGILGLLFTFGIQFLIGSAREKTRNAKREADLRVIQTGLELYYAEYGSYPVSSDKLSSDSFTIPVDPKSNKPYPYQLQQGGKDYKICAQMERKEQKCLTSQL